MLVPTMVKHILSPFWMFGFTQAPSVLSSSQPSHVLSFPVLLCILDATEPYTGINYFFRRLGVMEGHTLKSSLSLSRLPYRIDYAHPQAVTRFTDHLHAAVQQLSPGREIVCVCIGTDRSTGDALGP